MKIRCDETRLGTSSECYNDKNLGVGKSGKIYPTKKMLLEFLRTLPPEVEGFADLWMIGSPDGVHKITLEIVYTDRAEP